MFNKRMIIGVAIATISFLFLSLIGMFPAPPGFGEGPSGFFTFGDVEVQPVDFTELCFNGKDDNINGLIDCADPECFTSSFCVKSSEFLGVDSGVSSDLCDPIIVPKDNDKQGFEFCVEKAYKKCVLALERVKMTKRENPDSCTGNINYEFTDLVLVRCSNVEEDYSLRCSEGYEKQLMQKVFICCK